MVTSPPVENLPSPATEFETTPVPKPSLGPEAPEAPTRRKTRLFLAALAVLVIVTCAVLARRAGIDANYIKALLAGLGPLAIPAFVLIFIVGQFLSLPGALFLVAGRVIFGPAVGVVLGYGSALTAVSLSFVSARFLLPRTKSGDVAFRPKWKLLARAFDRLEAHPIRTVALLRTIFWLSAPFNYALASSRIKTRDYIIGSALGLLLPVPVIVLASGLFT